MCSHPYRTITLTTWYMNFMMSSSSYPAAPILWNHRGPTKAWSSIKFFPLSFFKHEVTIADRSRRACVPEWLRWEKPPGPSSAHRQPALSASAPQKLARIRRSLGWAYLLPAEVCPWTARKTWRGTWPCWACPAPRPSPPPSLWSQGGSQTPAQQHQTPVGCFWQRPLRSENQNRCRDNTLESAAVCSVLPPVKHAALPCPERCRTAPWMRAWALHRLKATV